jgi:hypothetical protein
MVIHLLLPQLLLAHSPNKLDLLTIRSPVFYWAFLLPLNTRMKIRVYTLFDITNPPVNRKTPVDAGDPESQKQFKQRSNFQTLLQVISLRSQPEEITDPKIGVEKIKDSGRWGSEHQFGKNNTKIWAFAFSVNYSSIFSNENGDLGLLYQDCQGVPLITGLDESITTIKTLDTTPEYRNIYFEVDHDEQ